MASVVPAHEPGKSSVSVVYQATPEQHAADESVDVRRDSAVDDPIMSNDNDDAILSNILVYNPAFNPSQPSHIIILCNHSLQPITLPTHPLTTNSRLFATLAHDPSAFSPGPLNLNIDHDAFTVFALWLQGGRIHVPEGDDNGFATDLYLLMRAHAAGEALGASIFADMVIDEIIGELTYDGSCHCDDQSQKSLDSEAADAQAKTHDLEILLQAAAAIWPPGSLGRDLLVDWYVHSVASKLQNLSAEAVVEIGDLDLAARCMVLGKERQMLRELGEIARAPYLSDPCRYHEHRRLGLPCYKRSPESVFSRLEFAVRCGVGGWEDDDEGDGDSGFGEDGTTLQEYKACVEDAMEAIRDDRVVTSD
jgi:hypothetical protein